MAPTGEVTLVPLDETPSGPNSPGVHTPSESVGATPAPGPSGGGPPTPSAEGAKSGRTTTNPSASPTPAASPTAPSGPAALSVGEPVREATDKRWCEDVSLAFHNTGETAVRSGTVTFGTHVIGALGVDWATVESAVELPVPIAAGARKERTWTVCVEQWRVPWGMHVETRDLSVRWR